MATQIGELGVTFPDTTLQTTAAVPYSPGFGGFTNMVVYTTNSFWMVPAGITKCRVTVVGGGGGGPSGYSDSGSNPSPGAGGTAIRVITGLAPGIGITVTVGAGGAGGGTQDPTSGGTSSFGAYCSATGGATGNAGGIGVSGTININGGYGISPVGLPLYEAFQYVQTSALIPGASLFGNNSYGAGGGYSGGSPGNGGRAGVVIVEY
jgi:hypothetical protein